MYHAVGVEKTAPRRMWTRPPVGTRSGVKMSGFAVHSGMRLRGLSMKESDECSRLDWSGDVGDRDPPCGTW
jgi:hypothetical protein